MPSNYNSYSSLSLRFFLQLKCILNYCRCIVLRRAEKNESKNYNELLFEQRSIPLEMYNKYVYGSWMAIGLGFMCTQTSAMCVCVCVLDQQRKGGKIRFFLILRYRSFIKC